jgi:mannosyl-3-phosphoglycerate phosphatase
MLPWNRKTCKLIVFSDLDGTILDERYNFDDVYPMIKQLIALSIPIVLCSSKTRVEIEYYRDIMGIRDPFIVENGAAIFLPKGHFHLKDCWTRETNQYCVVQLGVSYSSIRNKLEEIKTELDQDIKGFGDMSAEEISSDTGLPLNLAKKAKQREYTEPFTFTGELAKLHSVVRQSGLSMTTGGKYCQLMGNHDKGKAARYLTKLYLGHYDRLGTIGVGNEGNDLEMLKSVDLPFFISHPDEIRSTWEKVVCSAKQMLQVSES